MSKFYKVSKVLAVRFVDGRKEFKVRWKGYGAKDDSWVKEEDCNSVIKNYARSTLEAREKAIEYLVCEIGHKLSMRTAPDTGYVRKTKVKVPMDPETFYSLFSTMSHGRSRFEVTAEDLDNVLPAGWSERAFRTTTRCVVARDQPISVRFANQRKLHYDHSDCPRCQWTKNYPSPAESTLASKLPRPLF